MKIDTTCHKCGKNVRDGSVRAIRQGETIRLVHESCTTK